MMAIMMNILHAIHKLWIGPQETPFISEATDFSKSKWRLLGLRLFILLNRFQLKQRIRCNKKWKTNNSAISIRYYLRDRPFFFRKSKIFLPPNFFETSEPEESTGKKIFRKFEFSTTKKSTFIFLVNIIRI